MTEWPSVDEVAVDVLRTPKAGAMVIRGGAVRAVGFGFAVALGAATSVFLLRGLGVDNFGRYATVAALLAVVSAISDAGLMAVGLREVALRPVGAEREDLLRNLVALRIVLTLVGLATAVAFALIVGYDQVLVEGLLIGGVAVLLVNIQSTMMIPLSVELRVGTVTTVEVVKSVVTLVGIAALAIAGATLLPYFAVQVLVGIVVLALTPKLVGPLAAMRPAVRQSEVKALLRDAAPMAVALAMNVLYLRLLVVMVSLQTGEHETGLYASAFRVVELFVGIPPIVIGVAIPLLAIAGSEDRARLRYGLQRLTETTAVGSVALALVVAVCAEPALRLLGGSEYVGAARMLQIQVWALVPLSVGNALAVALLSLRRQRAIAVANGIAVVVVLVAGTALISTYAGIGAAVTGLIAEAALLAVLVASLAHADPDVVPSFRFLWRVTTALAAALATLILPLPHWVDAAVALSVFSAVAFALGAVPEEIVAALRRRAPGDAP